MSKRRKQPRKPRAGMLLVNYHGRDVYRVLRSDFRVSRRERREDGR